MQRGKTNSRVRFYFRCLRLPPNFGDGLVDSVNRILGRNSTMMLVSNHGAGARSIGFRLDLAYKLRCPHNATTQLESITMFFAN